jgi:nickel/cobalt exporter
MSDVRLGIGPGRRRGAVVLVATGTCLVGMLWGASAASAHPLGNATVNHYDGLRLYTHHLTDRAVEDIAEIPTLQRKPLIDGDSDGRLSAAEFAAYAHRQCVALATSNRIVVGGSRLTLRIDSAEYGEQPGAIGLSVGRLVCELSAAAELSKPTSVTIDDEWDGAGIGWHELTAVGAGVSLRSSPVPGKSISDELRHYPNDLLSSPLDQRRATMRVVPGADTSTYTGSTGVPTAGGASKLLDRLATTFNGLVGRSHLTLGVGVLAVLLAMVLGAGHAFLPGHGKTVMAAYLVGKRGRFRDVVTVGATVTLTHTLGVLAIGLLLSLSTTLAPTVVEQDLAEVAGMIVAGVGLWLLISAVRRRRPLRAADDELARLVSPDEHATPAAAPLVSYAEVPLASAPAATSSHVAPRAHSPSTIASGIARADDSTGGGLGFPGEAGHQHVPAHPTDTPDHAHGRVESGHHHPDHEHGHRHGPFGPHHRDHSDLHGSAVSSPASETARGGFSRKGLVGLGVAGGLVPSPSALLVLLAAVALGRTVFGIVLVLGYGVGMAVALTAAGLLLLRLRGRLGRLAGSAHWRRMTWLTSAMPVITACLVLAVGIGLTLQALTGTV